MELKVGNRVEFRGVKGTVRFVGETEFAKGKTWVGIELGMPMCPVFRIDPYPVWADKPEGKNNGSVNGIEVGYLSLCKLYNILHVVLCVRRQLWHIR